MCGVYDVFIFVRSGVGFLGGGRVLPRTAGLRVVVIYLTLCNNRSMLIRHSNIPTHKDKALFGVT